MSLLKCSRITYKANHPNPLFQEWMTELLEEALSKNSKLVPMLQEAAISLSKYPLTLNTGAECGILKGFDKRLCLFFDKRLEVYQSNKLANNQDPDSGVTSSVLKNKQNVKPLCNVETSLNPNHLETEYISPNKSNQSDCDKKSSPENKTKSSDKSKLYKPAFRSGGYAILITLLKKFDECPTSALRKEEIINEAQDLSNESFTQPKPESFYTAWSNMSRLITKNLVKKSRGKNVTYSLTETGIELSKYLLIYYSNHETYNDLIFKRTSCLDSQSEPISVDLEKSQTISESSNSIIEMDPGSYDIILLIDKQETSGVSKKNDPTVAQFRQYAELNHEYRSLKVGDFTWIARSKINNKELILPYIVERKRMDDLGASIKDGRFHEQKFRLKKCGLDNVIYLIENYGSNKHVGLPTQNLLQSLANTRVQNEFFVHMTDSLSGSARFLAIMTKRITLKYKNQKLLGCDGVPNDINILMTFDFFNKSSLKNKTLTITETFIKMLLQLKGASVEKVLAITSVYSTPISLIRAYKNCSRKEGETLLCNLKYGQLNQNVGISVSKAIYSLFSSKEFV